MGFQRNAASLSNADYSAISPLDGVIDSLISLFATTEVMEISLRQVAKRFPEEHIVMVMDKASWHTTGKLSLPENISLCFLPPYSPQLNPVEHQWKGIRQNYFANRVFRDMNAVEEQLFEALSYMNEHHDYVKSFSAFDWIVIASAGKSACLDNVNTAEDASRISRRNNTNLKIAN